MDLFVYGTLSFPEIVTALTGKIYEMEVATVKDFSVTSIETKPYPALIPRPGATANGWILPNVDYKSQKILDEWEGLEYIKKRITALTKKGEREVTAYVWSGSIEHPRTWQREIFKAKHLDFYLSKKIPHFCEKYYSNFSH